MLRICLFLCVAILYTSCSFNYNDAAPEEYNFPDITMEELEYVRVRDGELIARLEAKLGERYEDKHLMSLTEYKFEQYNAGDGKIDAIGNGGNAEVEIVSGNISMKKGVKIQVDSEDFYLETMELDWQDKPKTLTGNENSPVNITINDGSNIQGSNFFADVRSRTWVIGSDVHGTYVYDDKDDTKKQNSDAKEQNPDSNNQ
jgi:LPS export ABC transporter protein LptC